MLWEQWQAVMDQQALSHPAWEIQPVLCWLLASTRNCSQGAAHLTDCSSTSHSNVLAALLPEFSNILGVEMFTRSDSLVMCSGSEVSECKPAVKTAEKLYDQRWNAHCWSLLSFLQDPQHGIMALKSRRMLLSQTCAWM